MSTKIFSSIRIPKVRRNKFDLTHQCKLTTEFGRLTPFLCMETVPGDKFRMSSDILMRMMPLATPVMANFDITTHFFFVPQRLIWSQWEDFITGGKNGKSAPPIPKIRFETSGDFQEYRDYLKASSLANYLGYPPVVVNDGESAKPLEIDVRPFKAYQLIYNEYYRDENQIAEVDIHSDWSGTINASSGSYDDLLKLRQRAWKKDYFTSALPWPEQGGEGMPIPINISADLSVKGSDDTSALMTLQTAVASGTTKLCTWNGSDYAEWEGNVSDLRSTGGIVEDADGTQIFIQTDSGTYANVKDIASKLQLTSTQNDTTINDFRRALAAQKWLEAAARGGHRYIESILSHFGVRSSDARLQRPEYLGGGKCGVNIGDILQTSQTTDGDDGSPLGQYAGVGASGSHIQQFTKYFEEHGYVIGILSVMPRADYFQGIPKMFLRNDRYDYYWPEFAHIGEQPIQNCELFFDVKKGLDTGTFGYTPRYAEYKYMPNRIAGGFSDTSDELLVRWHDARLFSSMPTLGQSFLEVKGDGNVGLNRIFSYGADDSDHLLFMIQNNIDALRPMPKFGTPLI